MIDGSNYGQKSHWLHKKSTYKLQMHPHKRKKRIFVADKNKREHNKGLKNFTVGTKEYKWVLY